MLSQLRSPRYLAFLFIVLASIAFFNPLGLFTGPINKAMFYVASLVGLAIALSDGVSLREVRYPRIAYTVLIVGLVLSVFMGTLCHDQSLPISIMTSLPFIFAYLTFFIMLKLDINHRLIIYTYYVLAALSTAAFFINLLSLPRMIFGEDFRGFDDSRGMLRLPIFFIEVMPLLLFYAINQYLDTHKKHWIAIIAWISIMIFLSVTRQYIALSAVLGLWFLFRHISWGKKLAFLLVVAVVGLVVVPRIPAVQMMIELSEDQSDETEENIRITAMRYYTYENQENVATAIFGNGMPSMANSMWGIRFEAETRELGTYAEDVGWAGFYWYFGIFSTLALLTIFYKGITRHKGPENVYTTYALVFYLITSIASAPIIYFFQVVNVMVVFYLAFTSGQSKSSTTQKTLTTETTSPHRHFPQLR